MEAMLIYVPKITNRLKYSFNLILDQLLGIKSEITTDLQRFENSLLPRLVYGSVPVKNFPFLKASGLLFEKEIHCQELKAFPFEGVKAFFPVYDRQSLLPFDIFSASFYLVSRYEEYLPFSPDQHGRFEAASSCLHTHGMLQKPIVNIWAKQLAGRLQSHFYGLKFNFPTYNFQPTYDIDAAWSYLHKGLYRSAGGFARDFMNQDYKEIKQRLAVLTHKLADPFDTFELQFELQKKYQLRPIYFILFAEYGVKDKNISVLNPAFQRLIKRLGDYASVGIHPSYGSFLNKTKLRQEISALSSVLNRVVTQSRQHYLRMSLPVTYHHLIDLDITDDYTMGYASQPGFRAGIANSYLFYDLDHDLPTNLRIHPVMLMDGTLRDYLQLDNEHILEIANQVIQEVKSAGGTFVSLWHNETLSDQKRWKGWVKLYESIIQIAVS